MTLGTSGTRVKLLGVAPDGTRKSRDPLVMAVPVVFLHSNRTKEILRHMSISLVVREVGGPKRQVDRSAHSAQTFRQRMYNIYWNVSVMGWLTG